MNTRRERSGIRRLVRVMASVMLCGLIAAKGYAAEDTLFANAFAGEVDPDLFIGVLIADHPSVPERSTVIVYLCDGADVSTWLFGHVTGGSTVLEGTDSRVELLLGSESVVGVVERAGVVPRSFVAELADGGAGLFRAVATFDGLDYVGGWIVLDDGRQRGAVTLDGVVVENPTLDPSTGQAETSLGTFGSNCFRDPRTGDRICRYMN